MLVKNNDLIFEKTYAPETETYDLELIKGNKFLKFIFGGNGDLCISLLAEDNSFEITKENSEIYKKFDKLYNSIKDCKIVDDMVLDTDINSFSSDNISKRIKNTQAYKNLFADNNINYHSDNQIYEDSTILKISKQEDNYTLEFIPNEDDYIPSIEITNSGSRYGLLHIPFMHLYNALCKIDCTYHQIDIDEYMYVKKKQVR